MKLPNARTALACLIVVLLANALVATGPRAATAPGTLTVIHLSGKGFQKSSQGEWEALRTGDRLAAGGIVRAEAGSTVGLIASDGRVVRISGGREQTLPAGADSPGEDVAPLDAIADLFAEARRARLSKQAAKAGDAGLSAEARLAEFYQSEWQDLMQYPRIASFDLPRALETVSFYRERPRQNRALSLLLRIAADLPEHPGLAALAQNAAHAFGKPGELTLLHAAETPRETRSGEMLRSGDHLQLRYHSETESFLYLYLRSIPDQGEAVTARLFPSPGSDKAMIPPGAVVALPAIDDVYVLDEAVGQEFFWAWVCVAPLEDRETELNAVAAVTSRVTNAEAFGDDIPRAAAPQGCLQTFVFALDHR